jgi:VanZ family protein
MPTTPPAGEPRWPLGLLAIAYLLFAVYGSLVPLDFTPVPWDQALARWEAIPFLALGIGSRADWVANLLLFIPLAFLWLGWLWPRESVAGRVLVSLLLWVALVALSLGIEFTQIFFPPRTVSQNDILAESVGGLVGILLWWWFGTPLWRWVLRWRDARGVTSVSEYLLLIWLAGLFLYNVLPLDLTISPVEIYHKWQDGGLVLIPFSYPVGGAAEMAYALAVDTVLWLPVSLLWVLSGRRGPLSAFWWALGAAFLLEFFQFFVYSRVSDTTDLITAAVGAGAGSLIGARLRGGAAATAESGGRGPGMMLWVLVGVPLWIGILCLLFWYPYDFVTDSRVLKERLPLLYQVPFRNYYYGTEFRAVTEVFNKLLFFAPLGALLALGRLSIRRFSPLRPLWDLLALALILGVPALVELGQVALPDKYPDTTDWVLESLGAAAGYVLVILVRNRMVLRAPSPGRRAADPGRG